MMFIASHEHHPWGSPLSLTLPRKGGGNPSARACLTIAKRQSVAATKREVSTLLRLPPLLRERVGERGKPRALKETATRHDLKSDRMSIGAA
jgi:hypothetical protein